MQNLSSPLQKGLDTSDGGKGKSKLFQGQPTTQGTFKNFKEFGV